MDDTSPSPAKSARPTALARLLARPTLAIDGLPPALAALAPGRVHVVYAEPSPARDALFWRTAIQALRGGATLVSTRAPAAIAAALREHGLDVDAPRALPARANVCSLRPLPPRPGIDVLMEALQALADQCASEGSLFLLEGAEDFFSWTTPSGLSQEGARLAAWSSEHRCSILLAQQPPAAADGAPPIELNRFHHRFAGAAELSQRQGHYTWEVAFWRDQHTMLAREVLPLGFSTLDQRLTVMGTTLGEAADGQTLLAPDEGSVIVSRGAVQREHAVPDAWQVVDDNEAVVASAAGAIAATVVLQYEGSEHVAALAEQVHRLRRGRGRALKIVVREGKEIMRQQFELLLMNLGASLVVPRRAPLSRLQTMLEGIQGQLFTRPILDDYKNALSAVLSSDTTGYVPPAEFNELVRNAVERGRLIRLPHVLLQLPLQPEVAHVDALRACRMSDAGDICTASTGNLYAFFFGCRLEDADIACQRVFQRPFIELFQGEMRSGDPESILASLKRLEAEIEQTPPTDYSAWIPREAATGTAASGAAADVLQDAGAAEAVRTAPAQTVQASPAPAGQPPASPLLPAAPRLREAPQPHAVPLKHR